ncbi:MAG: C69 family dipeptidase, partial [Parafannyhessea umbonata]|nr:C69 family dipeptidase [Parafannyhessea umbonata]
ELVKEKGKPGEDGYEPEVAGGIGEEDMVTIVLPYAHSAREGVELLGSYLERYGTYEMNGIAFSDVDEIWWMETVGGHHWIAKRVPDDCYVTMPNQLGIDDFDLTDALGEKVDHMCSADLAEWMDANHLDLSLDVVELVDGDEDEEADDLWPDANHRFFNPRDAFGSHSDSDHVYNTPRAWAMHRFLNPGLGWDDPNAGWNPEDDDIPWCMTPQRKLTIEDVKYALSLHYQGTPYDPYGDRGDASTRGAYRPIGINRNGQLAVIQIRPYAPESCRAIQWMAYGSNAFNAVVPFFANVDATPEYLANTTPHVTTESFYWANRIIAAMADAHFNSCSRHIEHYNEAVTSKGHALVAKYDRKVEGDGGMSLSYQEATPVLEEANARIADMLREQTDKTLDDVLLTASLGMRNAFALSDH